MTRKIYSDTARYLLKVCYHRKEACVCMRERKGVKRENCTETNRIKTNERERERERERKRERKRGKERGRGA